MNEAINKAVKIARRDNKPVYVCATYSQLSLSYTKPDFDAAYYLVTPSGKVSRCEYQYSDDNSKRLVIKALN